MRIDLSRPELALNGGRPVRTKLWLDNITTGNEEKMAAMRVFDSGYLSLFEGSHTSDLPFSFKGGSEVQALEEEWCDYYNVKYSVSMNSATSGLFASIGALGIGYGDEVIVSPYTMTACAMAPMIYGAIPVFADVELETGCLDPNSIEQNVSERTRAILVIHQFGIPANMERIMAIAKKHNLFVIEDSCEAHGAEFNNKKVGSFGDISTFSFYLSHHISTMEGGMLLTKNEEIFELAKAMRTFGSVRDQKNKKQIAKKNPELDPRFLFDNLGYNIRPTEIQGAFGIHQIKKLEKFIKIRTKNANYWNKKLAKFSNYLLLHSERPNTRHAWFAYPITIRASSPFSRNQLVNFLEKKNIETRPIMAGDITQQPVIRLIKKKINKPLTNSKFIHSNSFFIGVHQGIDRVQCDYVVSVFEEFMKKL